MSPRPLKPKPYFVECDCCDNRLYMRSNVPSSMDKAANYNGWTKSRVEATKGFRTCGDCNKLNPKPGWKLYAAKARALASLSRSTNVKHTAKRSRQGVLLTERACQTRQNV